ncbi:hypothetical protein [Avibacterium paragallinarum]|uniref:Uncharacterized protein n=2 Tax=Avibacterium paragallinarum TaxID=728 RepID=A0A0F5EP65_AVIPA|nr:hypothetical protein [Avibacterium paragallinarum]AZI14527.1 hypothetical protein EIA51_07830 [Avibacterium paragallinarum]POY47794.1 hypothetical protein C3364_00045 [Avibacterium paragallinarum]QIR12122.1 hypothetical protein HBL79_07690 [Avibacterium paragallinarum]QLD63985.1 hypothetical protein VY92_000665 [Avibacterium paragallinarum]QLD65249.1 hypothetical protein VY92_007790 [Avibacterium paragallinarum]
MASIEDIIIPQQEINHIMAIEKQIHFKGATWGKKQKTQPYPYWLELKLPFFDSDGLPIPQLRAYFAYRPARRENLMPSMNFIAFYKNRRLFAIDQGEKLVHVNKITHVKPIAESRICGAHYHILHGKENQETGYLLDEKYQKSNDFFELMCYFLAKFNTVAVGQIPHPILSNNGQMELL